MQFELSNEFIQELRTLISNQEDEKILKILDDLHPADMLLYTMNLTLTKHVTLISCLNPP